MLRTLEECRIELINKGAAFAFRLGKLISRSNYGEVWVKGRKLWVVLRWQGGGCEILKRRRKDSKV